MLRKLAEYVNINDKTFVKRMVKMGVQKSDILIIGSGVAALQTALHAYSSNTVTLITKTELRACNSYLAQGGIAAAHAQDDSIESHIQDTLIAGCYHNEYDAVHHLVKEGPIAIDELIANGMHFDKDSEGNLIYGLEGAHSTRRILHSHGDSTGATLTEFLLQKVLATPCKIIENEMAIELLKDKQSHCIGVQTKDLNNKLHTYYAKKIVLATGGCGQLYPFTTNSINATGDGLALALRAGAKVSDMEFLQFHPTGLYIGGKVVGLVSEAVRGEGGILVNDEGVAFMANTLPYKDLSPRHIVAEKIFSEIKKGHQVFLDIRAIKDFNLHFPMITSICEANGLDWKKGFLPVAPASHFMMGGIVVNQNGETHIPGLYAVGEVACTGTHGANRLASNSLLEGLVYGKSTGQYLAKATTQQQPVHYAIKQEKTHTQEILHLPDIQNIQSRMFQHAGIYRTNEGLDKLQNWLRHFEDEMNFSQSITHLTREQIQKIFMLIVAKEIVSAAQLRTETRGAHIRKDKTTLEHIQVIQNYQASTI